MLGRPPAQDHVRADHPTVMRLTGSFDKTTKAQIIE
jgi:hypothetical protein